MARKQRLMIRLTDDEKQRLEYAAKRKGVSMSKLIQITNEQSTVTLLITDYMNYSSQTSVWNEFLTLCFATAIAAQRPNFFSCFRTRQRLATLRLGG